MISVLYVDDEFSLLEVTKLYLEKTGDLTVNIAESAERALKKIQDTTFDVIVSDYQMPGMDGIEFLKTIRASDNSTPFIIFSGKGREEVVIEAINSGADFYLQKGGEPKAQFAELEHKIRLAIDLHRDRKALLESETRLRAIVENLSDIIRILDREGRIVFDTPATVRMLGYPPGYTIGRSPFEYIHPDDLEKVKEELSRVYANTNPGRPTEFRIRKAEGSYTWVEAIGKNLIDVPGVDGVVVTTRFIDERKQAEKALRESEERFRAIAEQSTEIIYITDVKGVVTYVSPIVKSVIGYTPEEIVGKNITEFLPEQEIDSVIAVFIDEIQHDRVVKNFELEMVRKDGSLLRAELDGSSFKAGNFFGIAGVIRDITKRKQAEKALRESEQRYHNIIEDQTEFICRFRSDDTHVFVNDAYSRYFGKTRDELIGRIFRPDIFPDDRERVRQFFLSLTPDHPVDFIEHRIIMPDGKVRWQRWSDRAIFDESGNIIEYQSVGRDITEQKQAEEALRIQHNLALELATSHTLKKALEHILDSALHADGLDSGGVYVADPVTGCVNIVVHRGLSAEFVEHTSHFGTDAPQVQRAKTGTPFYGRYADIRPRGNDEIRDREGITALASIPVLHEGHLIAILNMASHVHEDIPDHSRQLLEMLAMQVSGALISIRSEDVLRESEERYRAVFENTGTATVIVEADTTISLANTQFERLAGYGRSEIEGKKSWTEFVVKEDLERMLGQHRLRRQNREEALIQYEFRFITKSGDIRNIFLTIDVIPGTKKSVASLLDITGQKRVEQALRDREVQLHAILQGSPIPKFVIDCDHRVISWNRALEETSGIEAGDILGTNEHWRAFYNYERPCLVDLLLNGEIDKLPEMYGEKVRKSVVAEGGYEAIDFFPHLGESGKWLSVVAAPILDANGTVIGAVETLEDITAIKEAEQSLRESEQRYYNIIEDQTEFICRFLPDGTHVFVNEAYARYFGKRRNELIGQIFRPNIHPDDREKFRQFFVILTPEHPVDLIEHRIIMPDGDVRWQQWSDRAIFDDAGSLIEYQSVGRDITDRKKNEDDLRGAYEQITTTDEKLRHQYYEVRRREDDLNESRQQMNDIINHLPDATFAIDIKGTVIAWNMAMEEMTGIKKEEIVGTGNHSYAIPFYGERRPILLDLVLKEDPEIEKKYLRITKKDKKLFSEIFIPILYGGRGAYLWFTASPLYDTHGNIIGAIESIRDITEKEKAEGALRISEQRYHNIIEDQTEFICRFQPDGTHVFVNEAYARYFGKKREEMIGQIFRPNLYADDREKVRQFFASLTPAHPVDSIEQRIIMPGGEVRWQHWSDRAIFDESGNIVEYQSVGRDTTAQKQAEEALRQANRQLKILTGTTRHDILNKVTVLLGYLPLIQEKSSDPTVLNYLMKLESATRDIQDQIEFTRIYQDLGGEEPQWQELTDVVARQQFPDTISLSIDAKPVWIFADPMFEKVFSNLLDNSIRHGQHVTTIRVFSRESDKGLTIGWVDNGVGIPLEEKQRVFKRGYGKNTGLGLFLVKEILAITGMTITETGESGKGARFEITVPMGMYRIGSFQPEIP